MQVLPMQYHVRVALHFCRINHWKPNGPLGVAPYVPLQARSRHLGIVLDANSANDQAIYEVEIMVDTPEYPTRPYCCRDLLCDLVVQTDDYWDLYDALHFAWTAPWSNHSDYAGISAKLFYFGPTSEVGTPMDIEQALPDCELGGTGIAPRLDLEVFLSHEWRLWQPLPPDFQYTVRYDTLEEGVDTLRVRGVSRLMHCHDLVQNSYYGW